VVALLEAGALAIEMMPDVIVLQEAGVLMIETMPEVVALREVATPVIEKMASGTKTGMEVPRETCRAFSSAQHRSFCIARDAKWTGRTTW